MKAEPKIGETKAAPENAAAPETAPAGPHLDYLDGMRALAALYVVLSHATNYFALLDSTPPRIIGFFLRFFSRGPYAVDVFIVLSGFCLMLPVLKNGGKLRGGAWQFFQRRAWRILPPYYLAMAFSLLLIALFIDKTTGSIWDNALPVSAKSVITHLLLVHDAFKEDNSINYVFWSIAVEWRIYFLFPLLLLVWKPRNALAFTLLISLFSCALYLVLRRSLGFTLTAHYIGLFCVGMLGASIAFSPDAAFSKLKNWPWLFISLFFALGFIFLPGVKLWQGRILPVQLVDYLVGLWTIALLIAVAKAPQSSWHRLLSWKPLTWLGTFSYSIYLIHAPLLQILWQSVYAPLQLGSISLFGSVFLGSLPVVLAVSYLFFLFCERPFIPRRKTSL